MVALVLMLIALAVSNAAGAGEVRSFEVSRASQIEDAEKESLKAAVQMAKNISKEMGQTVPFSDKNFEALMEDYANIDSSHYHFEKTGETERLIVTFNSEKVEVKALRIKESKELFFERCAREKRVCMYIPSKKARVVK
jgi:hypothetical protein